MQIKQILSLWEKIIEAYKANKETISIGCEKCNKGFIKIQKNPPDIGWYSKACECTKESEFLRIVLYHLKKSNLPLRYLKDNPLKMLNTANLVMQDEILNAEKLNMYSNIAEDKNWFYIFGNAGVGKTYASIALAQLFLLQEKQVYFTNVAKLLDNLRPDSEEKASIMKKCLTVDILILDDIGKEKLSEWVSERLFIIINERHAWGRITIFTSNISLERLFKNSNYPLYSRIISSSILCDLTGKDLRL